MEYLNTSEMKTMAGMFSCCWCLTSLDLSSFDTSIVNDMSGMFESCLNLKTIFCGDNWTIVNVSQGNNMFLDCEELVGGAGTHWEPFKNDYTYAHVDGGPDNPGYVTYKNPPVLQPYAVYTDEDNTLTFYYDNKMGQRAGDVYDLDYSYAPGWIEEHGTTIVKAKFDPSFADARPTTTRLWFSTGLDANDNEFTTLREISGWEYLNTEEVTSMYAMFYGATKLKELDLGHFNTSKVTDMGRMYEGCIGLESLDLSSFDTQNVVYVYGMFSECSNLTTIYVSDKWTNANFRDDYMFDECTSLVGGQGTPYDGSWYLSHESDVELAHIDGGPSDPGYLTEKNATPVQTDYDLWIADERVTTENASDILGNGSFRYVVEENTLYVDGSFNTAQQIAVINSLIADLNIVIAKGVELKSYGAVVSLVEPGRLTTTGHARFVSGNDCGIYVPSESMATIEDADLEIKGYWGLSGYNGTLNEKLVVKKSTLDITSTQGAVCDFQSVDLQECSIVSPEGSYLDGGTAKDKDGNVALNLLILADGAPMPVTNYNLTVGGREVNSANAADVLGDGAFCYEPESQTLTIKGSCATEGMNILSKIDGLTIVVENDVELSSGSNLSVIWLFGNTTLCGSGKLTLRQPNECGICLTSDTKTYAHLTIENATVEIQALWGIVGPMSDYRNEKLTVRNSNLTITTEGSAAEAIGDLKGGIVLEDCYVQEPEGADYSGKDLLDSEGHLAKKVVIVAGSPIATAIASPFVVSDAAQPRPAYNLSGQRVGEGYRGIVVKDGKKTIVK